MEIDTAEYERVHGRKPKGEGVWNFEVLAADGDGAYLSEIVEACGKFSEAKKGAIRTLKQECGRVANVVQMTVLPDKWWMTDVAPEPETLDMQN